MSSVFAGLIEKYKAIAKPVKELYDTENQSTSIIMKAFGIGSRRTFYKILAYEGTEVKGFEKRKGRKRGTKNAADKLQ